jgi:CRP-like cAMP-binding protein
MRKVLYLLAQLTDADVEWLLTKGRKELIPAGTILIQKRRPLDTLYIVLDGTLGVAIPTREGAQTLRLGCGEVVGEMSFVEARPPSATVTALEDSVLLAVPRQELAQRLEQESAFAARFYRALAVFLSQRLRAASGRLGSGTGREPDEDAEDEDELDPGVLDNIHVAGAAFDRVLERLLAD